MGHVTCAVQAAWAPHLICWPLPAMPAMGRASHEPRQPRAVPSARLPAGGASTARSRSRGASTHARTTSVRSQGALCASMWSGVQGQGTRWSSRTRGSTATHHLLLDLGDLGPGLRPRAALVGVGHAPRTLLCNA